MYQSGEEQRQSAVKSWAGRLLTVLLILTGLNFLFQSLWAHRHPHFRPEGEPIELEELLTGKRLSPGDYELISSQTGLSQGAVDDLLAQGEQGIQQILDTQAAFFDAPEPTCVSLLGGRFTCEDLLLDEEGLAIYSAPLAPLKPGDIVVSFATHTWGWRHGHAGLVTDPSGNGVVLEAAQMGADSYQADGNHWRSYSNFMVLRVKGVEEQVRQQVAELALRYLDGVPYSLLAGVFGPKAMDIEQGGGVQCAYLPWLAWYQVGVDLDGDGGRIVTVRDLVESPAVEVVQVCGLDPKLVRERQLRR